jgi:hypothetical protein
MRYEKILDPRFRGEHGFWFFDFQEDTSPTEHNIALVRKFAQIRPVIIFTDRRRAEYAICGNPRNLRVTSLYQADYHRHRINLLRETSKGNAIRAKRNKSSS